MPRKTKDIKEPNSTKIEKETIKKISIKKDSDKKVSKKNIPVANNKSTTKTASKKKSISPKNTVSTKTKKTTTKITKKSNKVSLIEYYDLPYRYNQTMVKILAQTPNVLFVYWDIANEDKNLLISNYGQNFFTLTKPVLIIHNITMNYSFEIEINDFANSWYLHVNDVNCKYEIELGRRHLNYVSDTTKDYICITSSNELNTPNNHILFEKFNTNVKYKNVKDNFKSTKDFSNTNNYKNMNKIYNIYDLYKEIYHNELFDEIISKEITNSSSCFK